MRQELQRVGQDSCQCRAQHTHRWDEQIIQKYVDYRGANGGSGHNFHFFVILLVGNGEGAQEINIVAQSKQGDQVGGVPEVLACKEVIDLCAQQDETGRKNGKEF